MMSYLDLHVHLDGSVTPKIAKELADLQGINLPAKDDRELSELLTVPVDCRSLNDFLKCFALPSSLMQTKVGISEGVRLVGEWLGEQGNIYAEIRFAPQLHTQNGLTQEEVIRAALNGLEKLNIPVNLILCLMRGNGNEKENAETVELAKRFLTGDGGVVALDLAGAEGLFPTKNYREFFLRARTLGIPFTIHAGEAAGAESVADAIELGARRIGHGVRSNENRMLLERIKIEGIPLELCPTSNRQTHAIEDPSVYPIMDYLRSGLCVTINTDDPAIEGTTIGNEFALVKKDYGMTPEEETQVLLNAVDAAFTSHDRKESLRKQIAKR